MYALANQTVDIRAKVDSFVRVRATSLGGRRIVEVNAAGEESAGALLPADGHSIAAAARYSREQRLPLLIRLASSGANLQSGVAALHGWGGAAREITRCSGVVPTLVIVSGPTVSGPALMLGLADIVIMVSDAYAFVSGPAMVEQFTGVPTSGEDLGGVDIHEKTSGVASLVAPSLAEAEECVADLLQFLPDHTDSLPPKCPTTDPPNRQTPEALEALPESPNGSYDCREIIHSIVDDGYFCELHALMAPNLVIGFASMGGRAIGIVANQPQSFAGTLNIAASRKGARFVALCDAFNLPLLTIVDTSGFYPGKDLEWRGMIRYGAQLAFAYARATVPRVNVTTRKSYGGAYIVMDSKPMGNDIALAWPTAEIAVMGAKGAVEILHRNNTAEERLDLERQYEQRLLNPYAAAERGSVDAVIDPSQTREQVCAAFEMLSSKKERLVARRHDNTPL